MQMGSIFAAAALLLADSVHAQIRVEPQISAFFDPGKTEAASALFGRGGYFAIAGGVVLGGTAAFYLEDHGSDQMVAASSVQPAIDGGVVSLSYAGMRYRVGMPAGLACPLGRFVERDGAIAYTVPKFMDEASRRMILDAGLRRHRIAREFDGTVFEPLLRAADFADTTPLPASMARTISAQLNDANGLNAFVIDAADDVSAPLGSLINTDVQVRYRVYLMASSHQVEVGGVPLRYFWELDRGGGAGVFAVDMFAQNWAPGTRLSDLSEPHTRPTQYDIVNFYQVAGLFRQLHLSHPAQFGTFVDAACGNPG